MGRLLALGAVAAIQALNVLAQDVPSCVASCASQVRAEFTKFSCANADDAACLCPNSDFSFGIRDCGSSTCGATDEDVQNYLKPDFCLNFPVAGDTESTTSAEPATTTEAPTTTEALATTSTQPPETTEEATTSESPSATPTATTSSAATTPTASSATTSSTAGSTPAVAGSSDEDGAEKDDSASGGLSKAATIGVAVGVSAAAIAIAALGICLFLRKRKQKPQPQPRQQPIEISKPLPGSGPAYYPGERGSYEKYEADIEMMTTNRYDDMPPRQTA